MTTNRHRAGPALSVGSLDRPESVLTRRAALKNIGEVVYAVRLADRVIKIGSTRDLYQRMASLSTAHPGGIELLGFTPGRLLEEMIIHDALGNSLARGREYYFPTGEVLEVVNEMRDSLGLPPTVA